MWDCFFSLAIMKNIHTYIHIYNFIMLKIRIHVYRNHIASNRLNFMKFNPIIKIIVNHRKFIEK